MAKKGHFLNDLSIFRKSSFFFAIVRVRNL